jgi:hypothetical protein
MRKALLIVGIALAALAVAIPADAKPAHVGDVCLTEADVSALVKEAVGAALDGLEIVGQPRSAGCNPSTYQACKLHRNGTCRPTRTYLLPIE